MKKQRNHAGGSIAIFIAAIICGILLVGVVKLGLNLKTYYNAVDLLVDDQYKESASVAESLNGFLDSEQILKYIKCIQYANNNPASDGYFKKIHSTMDELQLKDSEVQLHAQKFMEQISLNQADFEKSRSIVEKIRQLKSLEFIPENVSALGEPVSAARNAYDEADESIQEYVENYNELTDAEEAYQDVVRLDSTYRSQAAEISQRISSLGEITLSSKNSLDDIANQYDGLPSYARSYVSNYSGYESAKTRYETLVQEDKLRKEAEARERERKRREEEFNFSDYGNSGSYYSYSGGGTVYWVSGGSVYHSTPDCPSLGRSKSIFSGSVAQSGKSRACKNCF